MNQSQPQPHPQPSAPLPTPAATGTAAPQLPVHGSTASASMQQQYHPSPFMVYAMPMAVSTYQQQQSNAHLAQSQSRNQRLPPIAAFTAGGRAPAYRSSPPMTVPAMHPRPQSASSPLVSHVHHQQAADTCARASPGALVMPSPSFATGPHSSPLARASTGHGDRSALSSGQRNRMPSGPSAPASSASVTLPLSSPVLPPARPRTASLSQSQHQYQSQAQSSDIPFPPPATSQAAALSAHQSQQSFSQSTPQLALSHVATTTALSHASTKISDIERQLQSASSAAIQQAMLAIRNLVSATGVPSNPSLDSIITDNLPSSPGLQFSQTQYTSTLHVPTDSQSQHLSSFADTESQLSQTTAHQMSDLDAMILGLPAPPPPPPPTPTIQSILTNIIALLTPHLPSALTPGPLPPPTASPIVLATSVHALVQALAAHTTAAAQTHAADLAAARARVTTMDAQLAAERASAAKLAREVDALRERAEGAEAEAVVVNDTLAKAKADADAAVERVRNDEVGPARRRIKRLEDEMAKLVQQIEAAEEDAARDRERVEAEIETLREQLEAVEMDLGLERAEVEQERAESRRLRGELARAEQAVVDALARADAVGEEAKARVDQLDAQVRELKLDSETQRAIAEHVALQKQHEVGEMQGRLDVALAQVARVVDENEALAEAAAKDQETLEALTADLDGAREEVAEIRRELEVVKQEQEAKARQAQEELMSVRQELETQVQRVAELEAQADGLRQELAVSQALAEAAQVEVCRLRDEQAQATEAALQDADARVAAAEASVAQLRDQVAQLDSVRVLADQRLAEIDALQGLASQRLVELESARTRINDAERAFMRVTVAEQVAADLKRKSRTMAEEHKRDMDALKKRMAGMIDRAKKERDEFKAQLEKGAAAHHLQAECPECFELHARVAELQRALESSAAAMDHHLTPAVQVQLTELTGERDAAIKIREQVEAQLAQVKSEYERIGKDMRQVVAKAEENEAKSKQEVQALKVELELEKSTVADLQMTLRHFEEVVMPDVSGLKQQLEKYRTRAQQLEARLAAPQPPPADMQPTGPSTPSTHSVVRKQRPCGISGRAAILASENDSGTAAASSPSIPQEALTPPIRSIPAALRLLANGPLSSSVLDSPSVASTAAAAMPPPAKKRKRAHDALDMIMPAFDPPACHEQRKVVVGFTGFSRQDPVYSFQQRQRLAEVIIELGGRVMPDPTHAEVTHVFCPPGASTIKYYAALAAGKWLIHDPAWVFDSQANGSLLTEFAYGVRAPTPPLQGRRICGSRTFNEVEVERKRPQMLHELVQLGHGVLVDSVDDAEIVLLGNGEALAEKAGRAGYEWNQFLLWMGQAVRRGERAVRDEDMSQGGGGAIGGLKEVQ